MFYSTGFIKSLPSSIKPSINDLENHFQPVNKNSELIELYSAIPALD
jgi:hypothetical protein